MTGTKHIKPSSLCLWTERFGSWDEAVRATSRLASEEYEISDAYLSKQWKTNLQRYESLAKNGEFPRPSVLPALVSELRPKAIIDLGGANGWLAYLLPDSFDQKKSPYVILEAERVIDEFSESKSGASTNLTYLSSIKPEKWQPLPQPTLLYSLSMLQYVPDYSLLSDVIAFYEPRQIALEDIPCVVGDQFFTAQSFFDFRIPYRFVSIPDLLKVVNNLGYQLEVISRYKSNINPLISIEIENRPDALRDFLGFFSFKFARSDLR